MEPGAKNKHTTITINGKLYDVSTGKMVAGSAQTQAPKTRAYGSFDVKPAGSVHAGLARSTTLKRSSVQRPARPAKPLASRHVRTISPVATHPSVSRFGRPAEAGLGSAHAVRPSEVLSAVNADASADRPVGLAVQVQNYTPAATVKTPAKPAASRSRAVTDHALAHAPSRADRTKAASAQRRARKETPASRWKKFQRRIRLSPPLVITGVMVAVLITSVICYLTIPALSLFVAAKSAGVDATYPNYVPAGYHFKGPVTYGNETVKTEFVAAGSDTSFTITQKKTTWDSGAVLDNYVLPHSANYLTYSQSGMTIYTFGSGAAWQSGGTLHTIDGTAGLTSEQILRIAGSM